MTADEIARANEKLSHSSLQYADGTSVLRELESGLISVDAGVAYSIEDGIITLVRGRAIVLDEERPSPWSQPSLSSEKRSVQAFYDDVGWQKAEDGLFVDTALFVDQRQLVQDYFAKCRRRVNRHLKAQGRYLLDVASGAVHFPEYRSYSEAFDFRICVDLSVVALAAARDNLASHGLYVLGDITNLPLKDNAVDGAVSLHTVYHVPQDEQVTAFGEIYRVLKPGSTGVIVYYWQTIPWRDHSVPVRLLVLPLRIVHRAARLLSRKSGRPSTDLAETGLYFHAHDYVWFARQNWPFDVDVLVWSAVTNRFLARYVRGPVGRPLLNVIFWLEERFPHIAGRVGKYPMLVIRKP
jgi:ubiquinone/menaquinone biosynthesis C-methylase UbiE